MSATSLSTRELLGRSLGSLGVVFGDIGTSPLYAFFLIFFNTHYQLALTPQNIIGAVSFVIYLLVWVVLFKYGINIMRVDHHGEGGIFAIFANLKQMVAKWPVKSWPVVLIGSLLVYGACLLLADALLTPAISFLAAFEAIKLIYPSVSEGMIVLIACSAMFLLFCFQFKGSKTIGGFFGPVMLVYFIAISAAAIPHIFRHPEVLQAFNPWFAMRFIYDNLALTSLVIGFVTLAVTGAEALYADLGHFGRKPIMLAFCGLVLPALILNYLGQAAYILANPHAEYSISTFFLLVPDWLRIPFIIMAATATAIASQALISGAFSLIQEAISFQFCPRLRIVHTNSDVKGQIYIPMVNWLGLLGCIWLVLEFKTSEALAGAYGFAVTGTMLITTIGFSAILWYRYPGKHFQNTALSLLLFTGDIVLFGANSVKLFDGGYVPLIVSLVLFIIMLDWKWGRTMIARYFEQQPSFALGHFLESLTSSLQSQSILMIDHSKVFLGQRPVLNLESPVPWTFPHHILDNKTIPKRVIFGTVSVLNEPHVPKEEPQVIVVKFESGKAPIVFHDPAAEDLNLGEQYIISVIIRVGYSLKGHIIHFSRVLERFGIADPQFVKGKTELIYEVEDWLNMPIELYTFLEQNATPMEEYFGVEGRKRDQHIPIYLTQLPKGGNFII